MGILDNIRNKISYANNIYNEKLTKLNRKTGGSKVIFVIILMFVSYIIIKVGQLIIDRIFEIKAVYLVDGTIYDLNDIEKHAWVASGKEIETRSWRDKGVEVPVSDNQTNGIEFSWSVWIYINTRPKDTLYAPIFRRGTADLNVNNMARINGPGVYIGKGFTGGRITNYDTGNQMKIVLDLVSTPGNASHASENYNIPVVTIDNLPMKKWFHVAMRCRTTKLDVFINGSLKVSRKLTNIPKQNSGNIFIGGSYEVDNAFDGHISNLVYNPYALETLEIEKYFANGPKYEAGVFGYTMKKTDGKAYSTYYGSNWFE
jgi:hypothetical protein